MKYNFVHVFPGMGIEDVAVAQAILEKFQKLHPKQ